MAVVASEVPKHARARRVTFACGRQRNAKRAADSSRTGFADAIGGMPNLKVLLPRPQCPCHRKRGLLKSILFTVSIAKTISNLLVPSSCIGERCNKGFD